MRWILKTLVVVAVIALLIPVAADAQRICFSFASEDNPDGPNFLGFPPNALMDGGPMNADGVVNVIMQVQPFCDFGPISARRVEMFISSKHWAYMQNPFTFGNTVHNWAFEGTIVFWDPAAGAVFLQIDFFNALLTGWSPSPTDLLSTATWQSSEPTDPNILFTPGPELQNIMAAAGFPPNLLSVGEDFAFTLTNIRDTGTNWTPIPIDPATGDFLIDWMADGSFSATAGN